MLNKPNAKVDSRREHIDFFPITFCVTLVLKTGHDFTRQCSKAISSMLNVAPVKECSNYGQYVMQL